MFNFFLRRENRSNQTWETYQDRLRFCSKARFGEHTQPTCKTSSRIPAADCERRRAPVPSRPELLPPLRYLERARDRCVPPSATPRACASPPPVTSYIISRSNHAGSEPNRHGASARITIRGRRCSDRQPLLAHCPPWRLARKILAGAAAAPAAAARRGALARPPPSPQEAASIANGISLCRARSAPPAPPAPALPPCPAAAGSLLCAELEEKVTRRRPGVRRRRSSRAMSRSTTCYDT